MDVFIRRFVHYSRFIAALHDIKTKAVVLKPTAPRERWLDCARIGYLIYKHPESVVYSEPINDFMSRVLVQATAQRVCAVEAPTETVAMFSFGNASVFSVRVRLNGKRKRS